MRAIRGIGIGRFATLPPTSLDTGGTLGYQLSLLFIHSLDVVFINIFVMFHRAWDRIPKFGDEIDQDIYDDQQQSSSFILGIFRKLEEYKRLVGAEGAT